MTLAAGARLGPYEIVAPIGAGGMGEVWRARDTRLGRDVAIKVLPAAYAADADRLRRFEQEARAASALNHPNILAVFDVGSAPVSFRARPAAAGRDEESRGAGSADQPGDGEAVHYLVTELLEGESLRTLLEGGPLSPRKAIEYGCQIAQGLAAAHAKGIVHRDLKPENLFVTKDGHVKILDFGLAKLVDVRLGTAGAAEAPALLASTESGMVLGTVGYMAPEQVRGLTVDHQADIFALGCVLYEMLSGRRAFAGETPADTISAILSADPPPLSGRERRVPAGLERIVARCLEKRPTDRFGSARDLAFALHAVAESGEFERVAGEAGEPAAEPRPYPGLAAFTEADVADFFGREAEVATMWDTLPGRSMTALIGPSGAGKSSFLRAGLIPAAPAGWRCVILTPGQAPFAALARAFVPQFAGDTEATSELFQIHEPEVAVRVVERWKRLCDHALVVVDQFEELFTLNPPEVQAGFAALLGRIAGEADVHVLLSMRDDFFFACAGHPALEDVFSAVTPLMAPRGQALRRALVRPAEAHGFAFEDEALVDEILRAVEGERGALPMLAFAVARMWELRDREARRLTRIAYERIGGVTGALAQHAEGVLEAIGEARVPIVRELFRNLTTSQQTRCVVDADELLSVFDEGERADAGHVLRQLVDARLLTSFEVERATPAEPSRRRVELIHESLLTAWPRLVRWQMQDAEGAKLRDDLRQAARMWEEHGRSEDLLWAGTSYREYQVWRSRYPGGLSETEETFARAMVELAGRRRRRRRLVYAAVLAAVVVVAAGLGVMWRSSARETRRAERETRRAEAEAGQREAGQLLALGRLRLADHPNAALAYAIASLERSDNDAARRFAVEALAQGPPALFLQHAATPDGAEWSADGRWLAVGCVGGLLLVSRDTGETRQLSTASEGPVGFSSDGHRLVSVVGYGRSSAVQVWTLPEGRLERTVEDAYGAIPFVINDRLVMVPSDEHAPEGQRVVRRLSLDGGAEEVLGRWAPENLKDFDLDPSGTWIFSNQGGRLVQQRLEALAGPARVLGALTAGEHVWMQPWRDRVVTSTSGGEVRIWDVPSGRVERTLTSPADASNIGLDPKGRFLATGPAVYLTPHSMALFDLAAPRSAQPLPLLADVTANANLNNLHFSPDGAWLASLHSGTVILWSMAGPHPIVLGRDKPPFIRVAFTPDGDLLSISESPGAVLRRWPLSSASGDGVRELWSPPGVSIAFFPRVDAGGRFVVLGVGAPGRVFVVPLDGSKAWTHELEHPPGIVVQANIIALDPGGTTVAVSVCSPDNREANGVRIVDLHTGAERTLDTHSKGEGGCGDPGNGCEGTATPVWLPDGRLLTEGNAGLQVWDLATGTSQLLRPCKKAESGGFLLASPDSRLVLRLRSTLLSVFDLASRATREITTHGNRLSAFALDPRGTILVTGDDDGVVRVGPLSGEEPHLLFGHSGSVRSVEVSPDGRWIASASDDGTIRLWPMPDLSKPPLHTLPHDELLAKLRALTNLRAVPDPASDTGWKVEIGPFPGWAKVPEWQP